MAEPATAPTQGSNGGADPAKLTLALNDVKQNDAKNKSKDPVDPEDDDEVPDKKPRKAKKPPMAVSLCFSKKLDNRMQYLASLLIDKNKALVRAFGTLDVSRMDQVRLLELWWTTCEDRPRMHYTEFVRLCQLDRLPLGSDPALLKRLFREINMGRSVDLNSISFAHWSTGMVRWCTFSYSNVINLSFRLLGRSGGAIDSLGAWLGDGSSDAILLPTPPLPQQLPSGSIGSSGAAPTAAALTAVPVARPRKAVRAEAELANEKALGSLSVDGVEVPTPPPAVDLQDFRTLFDLAIAPSYGQPCVPGSKPPNEKAQKAAVASGGGKPGPDGGNRAKVVIRIYSLVNLDDAGGVDLDEYRPFAERNDGSILLAHIYQEALREAIFGKAFWIARSVKLGGKARKLRQSAAASRRRDRINLDRKSMGLKPLKLGDKTPPLGPAIVHPLAARGGGASAGAAVGRRASMSSSALVGNGAARVHPHAGEMNGGSPGGASSPHSPGSPHSFNHHHHKHHHHHEGARSPSLGLGASDDPLREAKRMPELVGGTEGCDADGDEDAWRVRLDFAAAQLTLAINWEAKIDEEYPPPPSEFSTMPGTPGAHHGHSSRSKTATPSKPATPMRPLSPSSPHTPHSPTSPTVSGGGASGAATPGADAASGHVTPSGEKTTTSSNAASPRSQDSRHHHHHHGSPLRPDETPEERHRRHMRRRAEHHLLELRKVRWAEDFGEVVERVNWERDTRMQAAAALETKTLRAALPDTRWPVVRCKLQVEVDEPPEVTAARKAKAQKATAACAEAAFGEQALPGLRSKKAKEQAEEARAATKAKKEAEEAAALAAATASATEAKKAAEKASAAAETAATAKKKGGGWALLRNVQGMSVMSGIMGKTKKNQGKTADQYGWRVKLTLNIEITDESGRWPEGTSISDRVLYAEELRGVAEGLAAYGHVADSTELTLLDRQRVQLGEWAPRIGRRPPGSSADPQGDPRDTSAAYSTNGTVAIHVPGSELVGGAEEASRRLIGYAPGELGDDYMRGRTHAKEIAEGTSGGALVDPGLLHKANYRALRRQR